MQCIYVFMLVSYNYEICSIQHIIIGQHSFKSYFTFFHFKEKYIEIFKIFKEIQYYKL